MATPGPKLKYPSTATSPPHAETFAGPLTVIVEPFVSDPPPIPAPHAPPILIPGVPSIC